MNKELKLAIVEKITDILESVGHAECVSIDIRYSPEEYPEITYRIKEALLREETNND